MNPLKPAVQAAFIAFTEPLEGRVPHMYVDILGLVTTGRGNLIDPIDAAVRLPWKIDGRSATAREIRDDWMTLKSEDDRRVRDGDPKTRPLREMHFKYAAAYTRCRLTDADIDDLTLSKLASNVAYMVANHFPEFATWPADAQLAACSMAWAVGPDFPRKFPSFRAFARAQQWPAAEAACKIREEGNPGVVPRNKHNRLCLSNAAFVAARNLDPDRLYWPDPAAAAPESFHPPILPRPEPLAGGVSVAQEIVSEGLRDMAKGR
jgi:hypothetical protein